MEWINDEMRKLDFLKPQLRNGKCLCVTPDICQSIVLIAGEIDAIHPAIAEFCGGWSLKPLWENYYANKKDVDEPISENIETYGWYDRVQKLLDLYRQNESYMNHYPIRMTSEKEMKDFAKFLCESGRIFDITNNILDVNIYVPYDLKRLEKVADTAYLVFPYICALWHTLPVKEKKINSS